MGREIYKPSMDELKGILGQLRQQLRLIDKDKIKT